MRSILLWLIVVCILVCGATASTTVSINGSYGRFLDKQSSAADWSTLHDATTAGSVNTGDQYIRVRTSSTSNKFAYIDRTGLTFNTSTIPDTANITSAIISIYIISSATTLGDTPGIDIVAFTPTDVTSYVTADFNDFGSTPYSSVAFTSLSTSAYNNFTLDSSGISSINLTGNTAFGVRENHDTDNSAPPWKNGCTNEIKIDEATHTNTPVLYVTYETATAPVAAFSGNVTSGIQPLTVLFTDSSTNTPTSWEWSFDDGAANDTNQNATRTFNDVGLYTIILTATNAGGSDSEEKVDYINVTSGAPVAAFSANRTTGAPGDVLFTDSSTNTPTGWAWSWGDGTPNGTTQNPTHTYAAGTWTVTLTATNAYGSDSEVKTGYITITNPPVAAFHANVTTGAVPLTVLFTDDSTGTPTSWAWDVNYNSGTDYATQNATHTYAAAGTYSVRLNATNAGGSDDEIKNNYIVAYNLYAFPGCSAAPKDVDADGYYEDINGNNRKDWSDLILFFTHLTWAKNTEPNALFDFANDGGTITFTDVNRLYPEVSAAV